MHVMSKEYFGRKKNCRPAHPQVIIIFKNEIRIRPKEPITQADNENENEKYIFYVLRRNKKKTSNDYLQMIPSPSPENFPSPLLQKIYQNPSPCHRQFPKMTVF
jgi:hypothetical protein